MFPFFRRNRQRATKSAVNGVTSTLKSEASRADYEAALTMREYQADILWQGYNAFLLIQTVLLGFLGTAIADNEPLVAPNIPIFVGALLGWLICPLWLSTFRNNYQFYLLRMFQARQYEVSTGLLNQGKELSYGNALCIDGEKLKLPPLARLLPLRRAMPIIIGFFWITFLGLMFVTCPLRFEIPRIW